MMDSLPRIIFHVDMDAFFASVEQRDRPALKGKPVIVGADPKGGRGRGVVSTCSYEARVFGIRSAMPISKAYQLCPSGIFLPPDMGKYMEVSHQIFTVFSDFTPDVEPISCDEAFLDMTHTFHLFGTPVETGAVIKKRVLDRIHLTASVGIAPNKLIAKMASDHCKPDGLLEITAEHVLEFLWPLPVRALWGVGEETENVLKEIGINTVGDLAKTPRVSLMKIFGINGDHLWMLANGYDDRSVAAGDDAGAKSVSREYTFEEDSNDRKILYEILGELSEDVSRKLRKERLKGKTITLKLRSSDFKTITRAETLSDRTNFFDEIYKTARRLFDGCWPPQRKIRLIGVRVSNFENPYYQESLFSDQNAQQKERVHKAVDQIKDKYGEHSIRRGTTPS
jgi:DNA polymerase IV